MIRFKYNLRCTAGHFHYSPTPEVWSGKTCMKALDSVEGRKGKKCDAEMRHGTLVK